MEQQPPEIRSYKWIISHYTLAAFALIIIVTIGRVVDFFGFFGFDLSAIPMSVKILFLVVVTIAAYFINISKELLTDYNKLVMQYNEVSLMNKTLGTSLGYKRELFCQKYVVDDNGDVTVESSFKIRAFQDLREITLFWLSYPGLSKEDFDKTRENNPDFVVLSDYKKGAIKTSMVYDGLGKVFYKIKFTQNLGKNELVIIKTKTSYPASADLMFKPDGVFKKIIKEKGKIISYVATVPTDRIEMAIDLPSNKKYETLDCLNGNYCVAVSHGLEDFMFENMKNIECKNEVYNGTGKRNEFKFSVDYPEVGIIYGLCWKEIKDSTA